MPQVFVSVPDRRIIVNGLMIDCQNQEDFPEVKDGLIALRWEGTPDEGHGYMQFSDDYMMQLAPMLYEEEVLPWIETWGRVKKKMEEEIETAKTEAIKAQSSESARFERLRAKRDAKLTEYDTKITQIERQIRLLLHNDAYSEEVLHDLQVKQKEWDDYAQALCNIPQQPGAPWDGGDNDKGPGIVPWPKKPE